MSIKIKVEAPPNFLMDSIANPKVKTKEGGVGTRSLAHNTSKVKELWDGTRMSDKWVNYSHEFAKTKKQVG
jgi:hypothetical protein